MAPGDYSPGAPTEPDVRNSRIRLLRLWIRCATIHTVNHARGLAIDDRTGVCRWDGVPMDASMAVEGVLQARGEFEF